MLYYDIKSLVMSDNLVMCVSRANHVCFRTLVPGMISGINVVIPGMIPGISVVIPGMIRGISVVIP